MRRNVFKAGTHFTAAVLGYCDTVGERHKASVNDIRVAITDYLDFP